MHVQRTRGVLDAHPVGRATPAASPRAPRRGARARTAAPGSARRTRRRAPRRRGSRGGSRGRRARRRPPRPNASAVCSARLACANALGSASSARGRRDPDRHPRARLRRAARDAGQVVVERGDESGRPAEHARRGRPLAPRRGTRRSRARDRARTCRSRGAGRPRRSVPVSSASTNASRRCCSSRACSSSTSRCGGADDVHHGVRPDPQRLGEREHGRDVGAARPRQLAEARPDRADRDPVGVQDGVDGQALLGPLAADRRGRLQLGAGRLPQLAQCGQRARHVAADRARQRLRRQPPELGDVLADALADRLDDTVELRLDLRDEAPDDLRGGHRRRLYRG